MTLVYMTYFFAGHMNGVEMLCLICIQNCLILWSHYSPAVCRAIMDENIFFSLFKQLVDLPFAHISRGPGQQVSMDMCKCHMQTCSSVSDLVNRNYRIFSVRHYLE